jgi:hypothetical protein
VDDYLAALVEKKSSEGKAATSAPEPGGQPIAPACLGSHCRKPEDIPPEDFEDLPKDGLSQIDHYVYGVPKRTV